MKICLINNLYHPWTRGGAEKIVQILFDSAQQEGHSVFTISTRPYFEKSSASDQHYYLPSLYFNLKKIPLVWRIFWHLIDVFSPLTVWKIRKIWLKEKPDLVFGHNLKGISLLLPRLAKKMDITYIHLLHDIQLLHPSGLVYGGQEKMLDSKTTKFYQFLNRLLFNTPSLIISPSNWLLNEHKKRGFFKDTPTKVVLNPFYLEVKNESEEKSEIFTWLFVGQLEKHKGALELISAYQNFQAKYQLKSRLWLVGAGSLEGEIRKKYDQENWLKIWGRQESKGVSKLMSQADCLIMPSPCYENSPTVIYEAVANQLNAIVSNLGGAGELAHFFSLTTFNPLQNDDLVEKMLEIANAEPKPINRKKLMDCQPDKYWQKILEAIKK